MSRPQRTIPLERQIPPEPLASPWELAARQGEMWYLPGWIETARLLNWRWIYFAPAAALLLVLLCLPFRLALLGFLLPWWKLMIFAVAVPTGALLRSAKSIIRARKDP